MNRHTAAATLGALALAASLPAWGSTISLQPSQATVQQSQTFTVDVLINALDAPGAHPGGRYGGQIVIDFDPAKLGYVANSLALGSGVSLYEPLVQGSSGGRQTLTFGFDWAPDQGTVATLSFTAIAAPGTSASLGVADYDDFLFTTFLYNPTYQRFYPDYVGASVQVVPLPGAAWLALTAFGALAGRARLKRRGA